MALGKTRTTNNRTSSSSSCSSTTTTVVVIAFSVLGLWMLTSNNIVTPHQPTTRTAIASQMGDQGPFEENPGALPDDALQQPHASNDGTSAEENKDQRQESVGEVLLQPGNESGGAEDQSLEGKETVEEQAKQNYQETQVSEEDNKAENNGEQQDQIEEKSRTWTSEEGKIQDSTEQFSDIYRHGQQRQYEDQQNGKQNEDKAEDGKAAPFCDQTEQEQPVKPNDDDQQNKPGPRESKSSVSEGQENGKVDLQEGASSSIQQNQQETSTRPTEENPGETGSLSNPGIPKESTESKKSWSTQAADSNKEKERRKDKHKAASGREEEDGSTYGYTWHLCNVTAGPDFIPCLDNEKAVTQLKSRKHFEHRERHCPEDPPTCLIPLPTEYKTPIPWPASRDKIWFQNVPHPELAKVKGHQNWMKVSGEFLTFPGGGTQFIHGALRYVDFIQQSVPGIAWGQHTRVILDVGCGVASFGGYLFERDVLTMSFAPKDEHEAQIQFALERGIPAISAVMGSQRLPFPSGVFDLIHCARCRVPWHAEGGRLLLELNRILRPGGRFVWSATPVYQKLQEDVEIWNAMSSLTASMCWKLETIQKDPLNKIGAAIYRKPSNNQCYEQRKQDSPPMCKDDDDPDAAWYVPLQPCMHWVPVDQTQRGSRWPIKWAERLRMPPYWLNQTQNGIYGKPAPEDFTADYEHWKQVVNRSYLTGLGISWKNVRNVMDMRAVYGGFAAALRDLQVWVLNVVNVNAADTLPIIYERGLFGMYHDWCEGFSTYPRTYDLLHADHLFSRLKERCKLVPVMAEVDRIVRPGGKLIVRDESSAIGEVKRLLKSLQWEVHLTFSKDEEGILSAQKSSWRPETYAAAAS